MTVGFGKTFKKIRTGKKMSLKEVSSDYLSVSFVSKFERGESEITLTRFLMLLNNLNVSIDEFYKLSTKEIPNQNDELIHKVSTAYYNNNILALQKYRESELKKYEQTDTKRYLYNSIMIEAFECSIKNTKINDVSSKILSDYLFSIDYWGKYELMILGNSMLALKPQTLTLLIDELINKTYLFGNVDENYVVKISLLINASYACIEANELKKAEQYLNQLSNMKISDRWMYEKFNIKFAEGLYHIKSGNVDLGQKQIEELLNILKILDLEQLLIAQENLYQHYLDSYI